MTDTADTSITPELNEPLACLGREYPGISTLQKELVENPMRLYIESRAPRTVEEVQARCVAAGKVTQDRIDAARDYGFVSQAEYRDTYTPGTKTNCHVGGHRGQLLQVNVRPEEGRRPRWVYAPLGHLAVLADNWSEFAPDNEPLLKLRLSIAARVAVESAGLDIVRDLTNTTEAQLARMAAEGGHPLRDRDLIDIRQRLATWGLGQRDLGDWTTDKEFADARSAQGAIEALRAGQDRLRGLLGDPALRIEGGRQAQLDLGVGHAAERKEIAPMGAINAPMELDAVPSFGDAVTVESIVGRRISLDAMVAAGVWSRRDAAVRACNALDDTVGIVWLSAPDVDGNFTCASTLRTDDAIPAVTYKDGLRLVMHAQKYADRAIFASHLATQSEYVESLKAAQDVALAGVPDGSLAPQSVGSPPSTLMWTPSPETIELERARFAHEKTMASVRAGELLKSTLDALFAQGTISKAAYHRAAVYACERALGVRLQLEHADEPSEGGTERWYRAIEIANILSDNQPGGRVFHPTQIGRAAVAMGLKDDGSRCRSFSGEVEMPDGGPPRVTTLWHYRPDTVALFRTYFESRQ